MEENRPINVAIDGPAGAGKSTIARACAGRLGYLYVDTGAMYRTIALYMIRKGIDLRDPALIASHVGEAKVSLSYEDGVQKVFLNGEDVSKEIRTPEVSRGASKVSAVPEVRKALLDLQKDLAKRKSLIMDGRDIGTVILPEAQVKIYLTASPEVRGKRRYDELREKGEEVSLPEIIEDVKRRDHDDMTRKVSPLKKAEDAVLLDSSDLTIDEVTEEIVHIVREKTGA